MSDSAFAKCSCQGCGQHIEFPLEVAGAIVNCPQCHQQTPLELAGSEDALGEVASEGSALSANEVLGAFMGSVQPTPVSRLYQAGLALVSVAMLLLPLIYLSLIGALAWGIYYWATTFYSWFGGFRGGTPIMILYLSPLFVGVVLLFFMVKPLFAGRAPRAQPLALNAGAEPVLFAFIAKVCETIGAPFPKRIDLDCEFNAAAGFRRGALSFLGNDLVLTIGLPMLAALSLRQFAGVLAHEFGHFTQSYGMRLSYVIRRVNGWFARVVHERDVWDLRLDELAQVQDAWAAIIVGFARLGVWFTRCLLGGLMWVGHGISCFMLREMEYDADSYEIKLVGSETFETTARRIHLFEKALELAYKNMRVSWNLNHTLPENFPAYLIQTESTLPSGQRQKLEDTMGLAPTQPFDTHPSKGDRIRRARQAGEAGVFHLDGPASALFTAFEVPSKQVSLLHYTDDLGIETIMARFVPVESPAAAAGSQSC